ncbi:MAG: hypothetical protein HY514_01820 [Candidatus Aenigmarchaeota archaeon]|nr:hypothetical protein [Candidatus Aenigmarchaeota archaeon]
MSYIQDFQLRVINSVSDQRDKDLLTFLVQSKIINNIEEVFGADYKERLQKLTKSGLIVEVLKDNPHSIQHYYQTTELGKAVLTYLISKKK